MDPTLVPGNGTTQQEASDETPTADASTTPTVVLPPPPRATDLQFEQDNTKRLYWDRSHYDSPASQMKALAVSKTLYVGNLNFSTRTLQIRSHFSQLGRVKTIHMGLDRMKKTPCGFCFVEYYSRKDALAAVSFLSSTKLDGKVIRVELDAGFQPGRQYGRGQKGGQVRHDRRRPEPDHKRRRMDSDGGGGHAPANDYYGHEGGDGGGEPAAKRRRM